MRPLRKARRAPLAVAGLLAAPLFFVSLMAFSLAVERPAVRHVLRQGVLVTRYGSPTDSTEARIWLLALALSAAIVLVGVAAMLVRGVGVFAVCLATVAAALAVTQPLDRWTSRHTARFPDGADLIADPSPSNSLLRGEWEQAARDTALSLAHWTIVLAAVIAAVAALLMLRRRRLAAAARRGAEPAPQAPRARPPDPTQR